MHTSPWRPQAASMKPGFNKVAPTKGGWSGELGRGQKGISGDLGREDRLVGRSGPKGGQDLPPALRPDSSTSFYYTSLDS